MNENIYRRCVGMLILNKNKEMATLQPFSDLSNRKDRHYKHQKLLNIIIE